MQMNEMRILIRLLRMCIPRNLEFGSALSKLQNFGRGLNPPTLPPSVRDCPRVLPLCIVPDELVGLDSSDGMVTRYGLNGLGIESW
jgi:hypothetical protein